MARRRRKKLRFTKKFPFITFSGPHGGNSCRSRLKRVEHHLMRAINSCDA